MNDLQLVGALDQGTSSTRFLVFQSNTAEIITYHQIEIKQYYPKAGWVEQDPMEILASVYMCISKTLEKLSEFDIKAPSIKAVGITNQRETTVLWDKFTGQPLYNAIVWLDSRTSETVESLSYKRGAKLVKEKCGLPITTYFSAVKFRWLCDNIPTIKEAVDENRCLFGTIDSWIIWNLTGGTKKGIHVTDVTNASRTLLMDIRSLQWDPWLCEFFQVPMSILPNIKSSSEILGLLEEGALSGVPISGCLGDQSAALLGQLCFKPGSAKTTYGTGCFLLCNTGQVPVWSDHGLLTTVAYKLGPHEPVVYALEGSVAIAGALIRWLRDNLGIITESSHVEVLAKKVESTHGVYFVPAFSGLYAPYWQSDARGTICGLTQFTTKAHIARAALEAVCFQTKEILEVMNLESGFSFERLQVDGGMTSNTLLMHIQADLLGIPVVLPSMPETTALGVAMAAGAAKGIQVWNLKSTQHCVVTETYVPTMLEEEREYKYTLWKKAVKRSMHWENENVENKRLKNLLLCSLPGGIYLFSSFALLIFADNLKKP